MMSKARWERFGRILHRLSYLKIGFYLLGAYYQLQFMFLGSRRNFLHDVCSALFMYGLAMLLEGLRDNELAAQKKHGKPNAKLGYRQWVIAGAVVMFSFAVLEGVFFLYYLGDKFVGEAILTFGIGGLALFRLEYDCLNHALVLREKHGVRNPIPVEVSPQSDQ